MSPELEVLLSRAYELDQLRGASAGAVAEVKAGLANNDVLAEEARSELARLAAVVEARQAGGMHGDHVSAVLCAILTKAVA